MLLSKFPGIKTPPKYEAEFLRFMNPLLDPMREKGGQARPREIFDAIAQKLNLSEEERTVANKKWLSKIRKSDCVGAFLSRQNWLPRLTLSRHLATYR
jgi:hypothetical protein